MLKFITFWLESPWEGKKGGNVLFRFHKSEGSGPCGEMQVIIMITKRRCGLTFREHLPCARHYWKG